MKNSLLPVPTTSDVGRLPSVALAAPLAPEQFRRLAEAWRDCGIWASQWNLDLTCVEEPGKRPRFWELLWNCGNSLREALRACAGEAIQSANQKERGQVSSLWGGAVSLFAFPTITNRRVTGAIVGASVTNSDFSEEFLRFCNQSGLDAQAMRQAAGAGAAPAPELLRILRLSVEQAAQNDLHCDEIGALAQNLETTYEELHLLYKISGGMTLTNGPARVLELVARELRSICRAAGIAFVLKESESTLVRGASPAFSIPTLADRIVQVGPVAPTLEDLDRLAETTQVQPAAGQAHLLVNSADRRPELAWAGGWLKHLVVLPLWCERRLLGVMFALNCTDGGDFTSVDVQLFRAVADRVTPFLENHRLYEDLADLLMGMLHALVSSIDAKDTYTCGHSERVAYISRALA
ncbi:MAG TPA: GAF domain-containing protein, partial [Phycisphaerae bacterium]|nr:GAF domain-containing protein [Phycisphaerae bacterium]